MDPTAHWENVYGKRKPDEVSWYQPSLRLSLELIRTTGLGPGEPIIDVGGGASTLVDELLALGYSRLTVLDLSANAMRYARERLGEKASGVTWMTCNLLGAELPRGEFALWHDRALLHFLTHEEDRRTYRRVLEGAVRPGGYALIATFGPHGPERCSGLPTSHYSPESLGDAVGDLFVPVTSRIENHVTPGGVTQEFVYGLFRRTEGG